MRVNMGLGFLDDTWDSFAEIEKDLRMALDELTQLRELEKDGSVIFVRARVGEAHETDRGHRGISFVMTVDLSEAETIVKLVEVQP
ncbi:hypothetical protein LCGC14_1057820 [marine sediment metagenome]|uniref:Uncharacterized protein n=1 Tax=marine sediment metagenome TaxID=412755 RepID=A0A0F9MRP3_9ZZZZ